MAFVFQTERKVNEVSKLTSSLGPGQYHRIEQNNKPHDAAPFQSSSMRKTLFQAKGIQKPGPGDYEISKPIVEPNIKSVSNSHSIILKINSTGTAQFKSTNVRFQDKESEVPGPGNYYFNSSLVTKEKKRALSGLFSENSANRKIKKFNQSFQQKNYPTIPQRTRGLTDTKKQDEVLEEVKRGPGAYNPSKTVHVNSTGAVWGKDATKRFKSDRKNLLGPGAYKTDYIPSRPEDKANLSAAHFRSATVRTYFDSLIYKTNVESTAEQRLKNNFKSKDPAPGQYDSGSSSFVMKQKPFSFQFFGSTVQRFPEDEVTLVDKPKKNAFYNVRSDIGELKTFNRGIHAFNSETPRQPIFLQVEKDKSPGPGQYKEKVIVQKKLKGINRQKFGSTTDRPFYKQPEIDELGPGKYNKSENVEEFIKSRFGQIKNQSYHFKSTTPRRCFGETKSQTKFGEYDVSYNDVAKKIQRQKMFLQNLKKIDVEKAPFQSTISRFPHYEQSISPLKQKQKRVNLNKEHQLKLKQEAERARSVVIESNRFQLMQNTQNGRFDKQQRFKNPKRGAPGVGAYVFRESWQKKSHNIKFQRK